MSWNVAGRLAQLPEQVARIGELAPDLVCLQEVTVKAAPLWEHALTELGLVSVAHPAPWARDEVRKRRLAVLTAAREPISAGPVAGVPWPERVLTARFRDGFELVNVHSPISRARTSSRSARTRRCTRTSLRPRTIRGPSAVTSTRRAANTPTAASGRSPATAMAGCARTAASAGMRPRAD